MRYSKYKRKVLGRTLRNINNVEKFLEWLYTSDYRCPYPTETRVSGEVAGGKTADEACGGDPSGPAERRNDLAVAMTKDRYSKACERVL